VEERAGLRCRLSEMTGSAGRTSAVSEDAAEFRDDPYRSRRFVKQQLPEVTLGFGCLELGVRAPVGKPWLRKVLIVRWHHQLLDATDLLVDEPAQLRRAVVLRGGDSAAQQGNGEDAGQLRQEPVPVTRFRRLVAGSICLHVCFLSGLVRFVFLQSF